jgi:Bacterial archaeo-eukaryotic release factor family 10
MITIAEAGKLGAVHAVHPGVLSLYLAVPMDPAELRSLPARADDLIEAAESAVGGRGHVAEQDRSSVREKLEISARDWLGRTVAMFACADAGLFEAFPLPCRLPDRAMLGIRPHIRPLLAAVQRCPAYRVAVVDRRHAWLFHIAGEETQTVTAPVAPSVRDTSFGGWYGLEAYRVQQRVAQLARHHYRDTAAMLEKAMAHGEPEPLVIGGHDEGIRQLLASLPPGVRERFAGSFAADTRTLTPARVRELAAPLVARWAEQTAERLAEQVADMPPGGLVATGLRACLAAVNACAVHTLIVPDDGLVPGYECGRCGALSVDADCCPDWGTAALPVPDVIEEMVTRTLEDGGQVCPVHDGLSRTVARLRFPVAGTMESG